MSEPIIFISNHNPSAVAFASSPAESARHG